MSKVLFIDNLETTIKITKARAIISNSKYGILLGFTKDKHKWGLPGSNIEDGETSKEAALREVHEETGLNFNDIKEIKFLNTNAESDIFLVRVKESAYELSTQQDLYQEFSKLQWFQIENLPDPNKGEIFLDVILHIGWALDYIIS